MEIFPTCDALHNMRIGGPYGTTLAYAFSVTEKTMIDSVRFYCLGNPERTRPGYTEGTGGKVRVSLCRQKVSEGFLFRDTIGRSFVETTTVAVDAKSLGWFSCLSFEKEVELLPDWYYFLVFDNCDIDPVKNFFSINFLYVVTPDPALTITPVQMQSPFASSGWSYFKAKNNCTPIFSFYFRGAVCPNLGESIIETSLLAEQHTIGCGGEVEQVIVFRKTTPCENIGLRVVRASNNSPNYNLLLSILAPSGMVLCYSSISGLLPVGSLYPSSPLSSRVGHEYVNFGVKPGAFLKGETYRLRFSGSVETLAETFAMRDGQTSGFGSVVQSAVASYRVSSTENFKPFLDGKWGTNPVSLLPLKFS